MGTGGGGQPIISHAFAPPPSEGRRTTTLTTVSTEAFYIDGPRVAGGAWSGLCYSTAGSRASAEAACTADISCVALHDKGCTNTGVRYCFSAVSEIVAIFDGGDSDACTYVRYQVTTSTGSTMSMVTIS